MLLVIVLALLFVSVFIFLAVIFSNLSTLGRMSNNKQTVEEVVGESDEEEEDPMVQKEWDVQSVVCRVDIWDMIHDYEHLKKCRKTLYLINWKHSVPLPEYCSSFGWESKEYYKTLRNDRGGSLKLDHKDPYYLILEDRKTNLPYFYAQYEGLGVSFDFEQDLLEELVDPTLVVQFWEKEAQKTSETLPFNDISSLFKPADSADGNMLGSPTPKYEEGGSDVEPDNNCSSVPPEKGIALEQNSWEEDGLLQPMDVSDAEGVEEDPMSVSDGEGRQAVVYSRSGSDLDQDLEDRPPVSLDQKRLKKPSSDWFIVDVLERNGKIIEEVSDGLCNLYSTVEESITRRVSTAIATWDQGRASETRYNITLTFAPSLEAVLEQNGFCVSSIQSLEREVVLQVGLSLTFACCSEQGSKAFKCGTLKLTGKQVQSFNASSAPLDLVAAVMKSTKFPNVAPKLSRHMDVTGEKHEKIAGGGNRDAQVSELQVPPPAMFHVTTNRRQNLFAQDLLAAVQTSVISYLVRQNLQAKRRQAEPGRVGMSASGNVSVDPRRALNILTKMIPALEICPLASFFSFKVDASLLNISQGAAVRFVQIGWDSVKLSDCTLENFVSFGQRSLKMVLENARVAGRTLRGLLGNSGDLDGSDSIQLQSIKTRSGGRAKPGELVKASSLYKTLACFMNFLRCVSSQSSCLKNPVLSDKVGSALNMLEVSGNIYLKRAERLEDEFRSTILENHSENLFEISARMKAIVLESTDCLLSKLVVYLYRGWRELGHLELQTRQTKLFPLVPSLQEPMLLSQLRGLLCCGITLFFGGHRPQVFRDMVLLPPCLSFKHVDLSLLADRLVSGILSLNGVFHLVILNDKQGSSKGLQKFQLPGPLQLVCVLLFQWRSCVLQRVLIDKTITIDPRPPKTDNRSSERQHATANDESWSALYLPLFLRLTTRRGKKKQTLPPVHLVRITENRKAFEDLKDVLELGVSTANHFIKMPDPEEQEGMERPFQYRLQPLFAGFQQLRVGMSNWQGLFLKDDPMLYDRVVELVRHGKQVVRDVYAPAIDNERLQQAAFCFASRMGFGPEHFDESGFDDKLLRDSLAKFVPSLQPDIRFAAQQLMLLQHDDGLYLTPQATGAYGAMQDNRMEANRRSTAPRSFSSDSDASLEALIRDVQDSFALWLREAEPSDSTSISVSLVVPYYLTLAKQPCLADKLWLTVPKCGCCALPVQKGLTSNHKDRAAAASYFAPMDFTDAPIAETLLSATQCKGIAFLF